MFRIAPAFIILAFFAGCDAKIERFKPNEVYALSLAHSRAVGTQAASEDVEAVIKSLFGTPTEPRWPADLLPESLGKIIDSERLSRAAGAVSSDKQGTHRGLYIEHCVTCHGIEGSGAGPAALLQNPYPRDFRPGIFKWKSTLRSSRPTRDDLRRLLVRGVPATGMPSFALINEEDREALTDYVVFLSIRGEVERRLMDVCVDDFGYEDEEPLADDERLTWSSDEQSENRQTIVDVITNVAQRWHEAEMQIAEVTPIENDQSETMKQAIGRGREIFHSQIANCVSCHGKDGNGDALTLDYDDWTKEYSTRIGITPTERDDMKPFRAAGALRPRQIKPRKLQDGVFRGGGDGESLYRRISQGIAGTPMPAIEITSEVTGKGLTSEQVWDLVYYLQSLGDHPSAIASTVP